MVPAPGGQIRRDRDHEPGAAGGITGRIARASRSSAAAGEREEGELAPTSPDEHAALARLLALRGLLAASEGRTAPALRDLEAALALADAEVDEDKDVAEVHAALARLLAADSPMQARVHAQAAVRRSVTPERTRERMLAEPALAGLLADDGP